MNGVGTRGSGVPPPGAMKTVPNDGSRGEPSWEKEPSWEMEPSWDEMSCPWDWRSSLCCGGMRGGEGEGRRRGRGGR